MSDSRQAKENCIPIMLKDVPLPIHRQIKKLGAARGISMRALLLELARREYQIALEKGEVKNDK